MPWTLPVRPGIDPYNFHSHRLTQVAGRLIEVCARSAEWSSVGHVAL